MQEVRIRENLHKSLVGKFMSAVDTYKNAQSRYQVLWWFRIRCHCVFGVARYSGEIARVSMGKVLSGPIVSAGQTFLCCAPW